MKKPSAGEGFFIMAESQGFEPREELTPLV